MRKHLTNISVIAAKKSGRVLELWHKLNQIKKKNVSRKAFLGWKTQMFCWNEWKYIRFIYIYLSRNLLIYIYQEGEFWSFFFLFVCAQFRIWVVGKQVLEAQGEMFSPDL